jgi:hypothetical protein
MKAIAIVELPDDAFDDEAWGDGKWMIDDLGTIRYMEDDAWMYYEDIDVGGIELRPLPQKKNAIIHQGEINKEIPIEFLEKVANQGYNACIDEILGEENG